MRWLTGNIEATPATAVAGGGPGLTIGQRLFPGLSRAEAAEFDRTAVGLLGLKWVLDRDHASFTDCQPNAVKLSERGFNNLYDYTRSFVLSRGDQPWERASLSQEAIDALETFIVINDLGKIESVIEDIAARTGVRDVDHDKVLAAGLAVHPEISPSLMRLEPQYRDMIIRGLQTEFNLGQFVQGENVPASLEKLRGLGADAQRLYLLHAIYDVAGAAGQAVQNGSLVMTEPTYHNFNLAFDALDQLHHSSVVEVYNAYLDSRGREVGLDASIPRERAITRLCCMLCLSDPAQAQRIANVYSCLTPNAQAILDKDLNTNGTNDGLATLVYYAPAVLGNLHTKMGASSDEAAFDRATEIGLTTLARVFQEARIANRGREDSGVFTVMATDLARIAGEDPERLMRSEFSLEQAGKDAKLTVDEVPTIHNDQFPSIPDLSQIPGQRIAVVGIGGGSDCVQAAAIAKLLERAGKDNACVLSVRTEKTRSQGASGRVGETRTVENHGGEIHDGVYAITTHTTGSGRFLENIVAAEAPTYLVIEKEGADLTEQINAALQHAGGVDTVIAIDTGGDALHSTGGQEISRATPDQDLRVLRALYQLPGSVNKVSCEIAVGIDSPPEAETTLGNAVARYYEPTPEDVSVILDSYRRWRMDGSNPTRFGKTALAWQTALKGDTGIRDTGLPTNVVLDQGNPWRPFVPIQPAMKGLFIMSLENHLRSIGAIPAPSPPPRHQPGTTGFSPGPDLPGGPGPAGGGPGG